MKQTETINQIKNITQEIKPKLKFQSETKVENKILINSIDDLIEICNLKREIKLKYELENNINLVKFENQRIEISFNENLDKDFVKDLSAKLFEWTNKRWIITFSKKKGEISLKDKEKIKNIKVQGISGSNSVKVTLNGEGEMQKIEISNEVLKEDKTMIEDLIVAAHNNAKDQLKSRTAEEISKTAGGFGIPGFKWPL